MNFCIVASLVLLGLTHRFVVDATPVSCFRDNVRRHLAVTKDGEWNEEWRPTMKQCMDRRYNLSLFVDKHVFLIAFPEQAVEGSTECPPVVFEAHRPEEKERRQKNAWVIEDGEAHQEFQDENTLPLGTRKLSAMYDAFLQADIDTKDSDDIILQYDVVRNSCAVFILNMMTILDIERDDRVVTYTTKQLLMTDTITNMINESPNKFVLEYELLRKRKLSPEHNRQIEKAGGFTSNELMSHLVRRTIDVTRKMQEKCTLCANGAAHDPTMEDTLTYFRDPDVGGIYIPCVDVNLRLEDELDMISPDSKECTAIQLSAHARCGCPVRPTNSPDIDCTLCKSPVPEGSLLKEVPEFPPTVPPQACVDIEIGAFFTEPGDSCDQLAENHAFFCDCKECPPETPGCDTTPLPCRICANGELLPEFQDVAILPGTSCSQFQELVITAGFLGDDCPALQATASPYCGCDNPPVEGECRLCGDGELLPDVLEEVECVDLALDTFKSATCGRLEWDGATFDRCEYWQSTSCRDLCRAGTSGSNGKKGKKGKKDSTGKKGEKEGKKGGGEGKKGPKEGKKGTSEPGKEGKKGDKRGKRGTSEPAKEGKKDGGGKTKSPKEPKATDGKKVLTERRPRTS